MKKFSKTILLLLPSLIFILFAVYIFLAAKHGDGWEGTELLIAFIIVSILAFGYYIWLAVTKRINRLTTALYLPVTIGLFILFIYLFYFIVSNPFQKKDISADLPQNQIVEEIIQTNNKTLNSLINAKGANPENFYLGPCAYLHGADGEIKNWQGFSEEKHNSLIKLFNALPTTKLDYSQNPNNVSDQIYIGPLCNCTEYNKAIELIKKYNINFNNQLIHGTTDELENCIK